MTEEEDEVVVRIVPAISPKLQQQKQQQQQQQQQHCRDQEQEQYPPRRQSLSSSSSSSRQRQYVNDNDDNYDDNKSITTSTTTTTTTTIRKRRLRLDQQLENNENINHRQNDQEQQQQQQQNKIIQSPREQTGMRTPQMLFGSPPLTSPPLSPVGSLSCSMSPAFFTSAGATKRHVWVIRHGERADLADKKKWAAAVAAASSSSSEGVRRYDPPLTRMGVLTAYVTGKSLSQMKTPGAVPQIVLCSPFLRCLQTAVQIARTCGGCPIAVEPALCEYISADLFGGELPGPMLSQEEFVARYCDSSFTPTFVDNSTWRVRDSVPQHWESRFDLQDRCRDMCAWLDSPVARMYESIAVVTHGTVIVMAGMYMDESKPWPAVETPYCCVTHFVGFTPLVRTSSPTMGNASIATTSSSGSSTEPSVSLLSGSAPTPRPEEIRTFDDRCGSCGYGYGYDDGEEDDRKRTNWKAVLVCTQKHLKRK